MGNLTESELKSMGLEEIAPGKYRKIKKTKKKVPTEVDKKAAKPKETKQKKSNPPLVPYSSKRYYSFKIANPPTYIKKNKKGDKVYYTANVFYTSNHFSIRHKIKDAIKPLLSPYIMELKSLPPGRMIEFVFCFKGSVTGKDVNNRGYFWDKFFTDFLQEYNIIGDDDMYWIPEVRYKYNPNVNENSLTINIY